MNAPRSLAATLPLVLAACAHMPTDVVHPQRYLGMREAPASVEAGAPLQRGYRDLFRAWQKSPPLARILVVDIEGDDRYAMIEFQSLGDPGAEEGYRAILYRKAGRGADGAMDDIYAPGDTFLDPWRKAEPIPQETAYFLPLDIQWDTSRTLRMHASFEDPFQRRWEVSFADRRQGIPPSGVLAPVADRIRTPESFPFIFMEDITLVPKADLHSSIKVDGKALGIATFPVLMDGKLCSFLRYSNAVSMLDLMAGNTPASSSTVETRLLQDDSGSLAGATWTSMPGSRLVSMRFHPGLPPPGDLPAGGGQEGRWILGASATRAAVAGRYTLRRIDDRAILSLRIEKGWSPYGGKAWMKTFRLDAETRIDDSTGTWTKHWTREER